MIYNGGGYSRTLAIVKSGAGKLTLAGTTGVNNAWTGGTTVNGGTLQFGDGTSNAVLPGNAVVNSGATIAFDVTTSTVVTYPGVISGAGGVTVLGTGKLTLTGANTYTVAMAITSGTLQIGDGTTNGVLPSNASVSSGSTIAFDVATSTVVTYPKAIWRGRRHGSRNGRPRPHRGKHLHRPHRRTKRI